MSRKTSLLNKSGSLLKKQYSSGGSSNNNVILKLQKDTETMKSSYTQLVSPPLRFSIEVEIEQCDPEDIITGGPFTKILDPNLSVPKAYVTKVIKVDGKHADPKLSKSLAEDSKGVPKNNGFSNPNIEDDIIILDTDEPSKESAVNPKNLNNKGFDIKKMQTQLDEDIKKQLEVEAKLSKLFQGSKSYQLLMQKELSERKTERNMSRNKELKKQLIKKPVTNELLKKKPTKQETLQTLIKIEEDMYVGDLKILDNGVEDLSTINDFEGAVTTEITNSKINNDTVAIKEEKKKELGEKNVNKIVLKNITKDSHLHSDIILDCYSINSEQSNWDIPTIVKKETLIKDEAIVEPEEYIQTKIKVEPSGYLMKDYEMQQTIVKKESCFKDYTIKKIDGNSHTKVKVKPSYYVTIYDKQPMANREIIKTESDNPICQCRCGHFAVLKKIIAHVSIECPCTVFSCNLCSELVRFNNLKHYLIHLPIHKFKPLSCPECQVQLKSSNGLYIHVRAHIRNLFSAKKPMEQQENLLYFCKKCGNCVPMEYFFRHWQMHWNGQNSDIEKNDSMEDSSDDDQDLKIMSPKVIEEVLKKKPTNRITCCFGVSFNNGLGSDNNMNPLKEMLQKKTKPKLMKECTVCVRKFSRWQECKRHLIEHLLSQAIYERKKLGSEILKCYFCDEGFETLEDWKFHTREHSNLRIYKCELCWKRFSDSSNLCKHKKSHNLFSFVCDLCGGKFTSKRCLIAHIQKHENTMNCEYCNMSFVRPGKLRTHIMRVHTEYNKTVRREHRCNVCLKKFFTWKKKKQHMWLKHGKRNDSADCPLCENRYRKFYELRRHMAVKHNTAYTKSLREVLGN